MKPAELEQASGRHCSPLVWRTVVDYLAGQRHPLELLQQA